MLSQEKNEKLVLADVFSLFVGGDAKFRPELLKPFEINGKVYATDGIALVRTDKVNIDFVIDNKHKTPNCERVIPEINTSLILSITKEMLEPLKTDDEIEITGKNIDCKTCDGSGTVEWIYESHIREFDCPVCEGSGYSEEERSRKTGGKTFGHFAVNVKGVYFDIDKFYKLVKAREFIGGEIELISYSTKRMLFKIGVCEILLMPVIYDESNWDGVLVV